ncbi:hypothetical protein [Hyphomonas sp.]|uniref:hypothetical protein n=1 Tax=Hyphomonas sp. TaxID=87 RepID=UPI0025BC5CE2|nr:hypothetical protein [Hyphomonas sp.]
MTARVRTRMDVLERDIVAFVGEDLAPAAQAEIRARVAREHLADAQSINRIVTGRVPEHDTFVDGRAGAPLESVKPNGVVVFEFELVADVLLWIHTALKKHSPRFKGDYQTSHQLFADDVEVADIENPPSAREYVFLNEQPYARKIERGQSKQAPEGVYEGIAALAKQRFGNVTSIGFGFREFPGGALLKWAAMRKPSRTGYSRRARQAALRRDTRQPAIIVRTSK